MATFKGMLNSQGKVCGVFEETLNPFTRFQMCAELDHIKKQYKFGMGFNLGL
jgi:hypothetical protein